MKGEMSFNIFFHEMNGSLNDIVVIERKPPFTIYAMVGIVELDTGDAVHSFPGRVPASGTKY